jgi:pyrroloquinoline quinone (PQQ) biosynthesis protein C
MKALLNSCVERLGSASQCFPWEQRVAYWDWLAQTYYYVRHSTRLLAAAAARFPLDERGSALHGRFTAHMGEEKRHEQLAIHDLKKLGGSIESMPEHPATRMFYEPQYYKIEHESPLALFGYILLLEAIGPTYGKQTMTRITAAHGEGCVAFLRLHSEDDVEHLNKALEIIRSLPVQDRASIEQNLVQSTYAYSQLLNDVEGRSKGKAMLHSPRDDVSQWDASARG